MQSDIFFFVMSNLEYLLNFIAQFSACPMCNAFSDLELEAFA